MADSQRAPDYQANPAAFGNTAKKLFLAGSVTLGTLLTIGNVKAVPHILNHLDNAATEGVLYGNGNGDAQKERQTAYRESAGLAALDIVTAAATGFGLGAASRCQSTHADKVKKPDMTGGPDPKAIGRG